MLFKQQHLNGIRDGHISLAFRRWNKATAKAGSIVKTTIGQVEIISVAATTETKITAADARRAGFADKAALLDFLGGREGTLYRIEVRYHSEDPRIALREEADPDEADWTELDKRLDRLDKASSTGPWTKQILEAIAQNPHLRAADLALKTGHEKEWLKLNIRKLKNLGLTISHDPGYTLSPRGEALLRRSA